jgi:hypothetical protein
MKTPDIITGFVKMVCEKVCLDVKTGDDLDIRHFVKVPFFETILAII